MTELKTNGKAPAFQATDQNGGTVRLDDYYGRKLFIYFYPKANTSG